MRERRSAKPLHSGQLSEMGGTAGPRPEQAHYAFTFVVRVSRRAVIAGLVERSTSVLAAD